MVGQPTPELQKTNFHACFSLIAAIQVQL